MEMHQKKSDDWQGSSQQSILSFFGPGKMGIIYVRLSQGLSENHGEMEQWACPVTKLITPTFASPLLEWRSRASP